MYDNLLQRYERDLTLRGFSPRTRKTYYRSLTAFLNHTRKDPDEISKETIKDYLYYLVQERNLSASTLRQARCAISYFFSQTLSRTIEVENIPCQKKEKKLPAVFSVSEVFKIINSAANLKHKTILMLVYSSCIIR
jgi:integrase/recombinase XerD